MKATMLFVSCLVFLSLSASGLESNERTPRFLVHILDYIAIDYPGAVQGGKLVSKEEYAEQVEFSNTAEEIFSSLPQINQNAELKQGLLELKTLISEKAPENKVALLAKKLEQKVIVASQLETRPKVWPSLHRGKAIYEKNCTQCHGLTGHGDGPSSGMLEPKPTDFYNAKIDGLPPFQMFNTIRLGVPGTAMAGFSSLTDSEVWDLAFYISSFRYGTFAKSDSSGNLDGPISLELAATQSDQELAKKLGGNTEEVKAQLKAIRLHLIPENSDLYLLQGAVQKVNAAKKLYLSGEIAKAKDSSVIAYLDFIEPIEPKLRARDFRLTTEIESAMSAFRGGISNGASVEQLDKLYLTVMQTLERAKDVLSVKESSPWFTASIAGGIVLREAFEAALIIITLLGVLKGVSGASGGTTAALWSVHLGWILAVGIGLITWFFSGWIVAMSGAQREILEGTISLLAVVVLLYFGFWLHRKTEIGRWRTFIQGMVHSAMNRKNLIGLGAIAFMGVFREAFETVLFLRALLIESGGAQEWAVGIGVLFSFTVVLILSALIVRFSARIPIRQLFAVSSAILVFLSAVLIGKAIHSFQETGLIGVTPLPKGIRFDLFGLYPTYETLLPQITVLIAIPLIWTVLQKVRPSFWDSKAH